MGTTIERGTGPYVVSGDIKVTTTNWAHENNFTPPSADFITGQSEELVGFLRGVFPVGIEFVPDEEIREGMNRLIAESPFPVVSLDRAYVDPAKNVVGFIDVNRVVNERLDDIGLRSRPGHQLESQITALRTPERNPIVLADDVIFSGGGVAALSEKLNAVNRPVAGVIAGIVVRQGADRLEKLGIKVVDVRRFGSVVDEVCERDFRVGVPFSGRTGIDAAGNIFSAPYFLPFGKPVDWASIPQQHVRAFSQLCIEQSTAFWGQVERKSNAVVRAGVLPRRVRGLREDVSIVTQLREQEGMLKDSPLI